jgi:[ribosomal protein S5]-alanine N-acetyltransferase
MAHTAMAVCETSRLQVRRLHADDAAFILQLLNEPSFLENIGDRGVRTLDDARAYIANGPLTSYGKYGFGLFHVSLRDSGQHSDKYVDQNAGKYPDHAIGMCGLLKRDWLDDVDVGFAFLPRFWGMGYAYESSVAIIEWARRSLGVTRVVGITKPDNQGSIRVLKKLGLRFERIVTSPEGQQSSLFTPPGTAS